MSKDYSNLDDWHTYYPGFLDCGTKDRCDESNPDGRGGTCARHIGHQGCHANYGGTWSGRQAPRPFLLDLADRIDAGKNVR